MKNINCIKYKTKYKLMEINNLKICRSNLDEKLIRYVGTLKINNKKLI